MKTIELERKYRIEQKDVKTLVEFCKSFYYKDCEILNLVDYRFSVTKNSFGGSDFERLRIVKDNEGNLKNIIRTKKYTDESGVRREIEKEVTEEEAGKLVSGSKGKIIKKTRLDWHGSIAFDSLVLNGFSFAIDTVDADAQYSFWEIEVLSERKDLEDIYYRLFDFIASVSGIPYLLEEKSMLQMSKDFYCNDLDHLMAV